MPSSFVAPAGLADAPAGGRTIVAYGQSGPVPPKKANEIMPRTNAIVPMRNFTGTVLSVVGNSSRARELPLTGVYKSVTNCKGED